MSNDFNLDSNLWYNKIISFPKNNNNITLKLLSNIIYDYYGEEYIKTLLQNKEIYSDKNIYININDLRGFFLLLLKTFTGVENENESLCNISDLEKSYKKYFQRRFTISIENILINKKTVGTYDIFKYINNISSTSDKNIISKLYLTTFSSNPQLKYTLKNDNQSISVINNIIKNTTYYVNKIILPLFISRYIINKSLFGIASNKIKPELGYYKDGDVKFASMFFCGLYVIKDLNPTILDEPYHYKNLQFNENIAKEIFKFGKDMFDMCIVNMSMKLFDNNYEPFIVYITNTNTKHYTTYSEVSENIFRYYVKYLDTINKPLDSTTEEYTVDEIINLKKQQTSSYVNTILKDFFYIPDNDKFIFSDFEFTDYEKNYLEDDYSSWRGEYAHCIWEYIFCRNNGGNDNLEENMHQSACKSLIEYISDYNDNESNKTKISVKDCCFNSEKIYSEYKNHTNSNMYTSEYINFNELVQLCIHRGIISTEFYQVIGYPAFYTDFIKILKELTSE